MKFKLIEDNQYIRNKKRLPEFSHADLLTAEEAKNLPLRLRKSRWYWWINAKIPQEVADKRFREGVVATDGRVWDYVGAPIAYENAIRPALRITNLNDYKIGSLFKFGGQWFEIIDEHTAFCLRIIDEHRFDLYSNDYDKSYLKQYIDDWFNKNNK